MLMSENQLMDLLKSHQGCSPANIAQRILEIECEIKRVHDGLYALGEQRVVEAKRHKKELSRIDAEIMNLQSTCKHEWQTTGDPSGGTDRDTTCIICGKQE